MRQRRRWWRRWRGRRGRRGRRWPSPRWRRESPTHPGTYTYEPFARPLPDIQPFAGPTVRPIEYAPLDKYAPLEYEPFVAPTPDSLLDDPGYQFRRSEGLNAVLHSAASRGLSRGGSALKALDRYGQGFASNEFGQLFNRSVTTHGLGRQSALDEYSQGRQLALDKHGSGRQLALDQYTSDTGAHGRSLDEYLVNTGNDADQWGRSLAGWSANNRAGLSGYQVNTGAFDAYWGRLLQQYSIDRGTTPPPYVPPPPPPPIF